MVAEASAGDMDAARRRLETLEEIELVEITDEAREMARLLVASKVIPATAPEDALHIAAAAQNGANYLITWNCKHIAHAAIRSGIEGVCRRLGLEPPVVCTPLELLEEIYDDT